MFMISYNRLVTACLLTAGVAGNQIGFFLAIGLTVLQLIHFTIREHSITAFPVQVRFWYLMVLLVALPEPLRSTSGCLPWERGHRLFGYCTMARCVSLLPWKGAKAFHPGLLKKTFISRPVRGNIMEGLPPVKQT